MYFHGQAYRPRQSLNVYINCSVDVVHLVTFILENVYKFTTVRTDMLHKAGCGLITLIRDNITFTTTYIPSTINTHNFKWSRYTLTTLNISSIANIYIPQRNSTSMHYKTKLQITTYQRARCITTYPTTYYAKSHKETTYGSCSHTIK